jgi:hypothetical protein
MPVSLGETYPTPIVDHQRAREIARWPPMKDQGRRMNLHLPPHALANDPGA